MIIIKIYSYLTYNIWYSIQWTQHINYLPISLWLTNRLTNGQLIRNIKSNVDILTKKNKSSSELAVMLKTLHSPVTRITWVRILIAIAALYNLDVKIIFLNNDLDKEIYIKQPKGSK